jgi:uncharacterized membrane protein
MNPRIVYIVEMPSDLPLWALLTVAILAVVCTLFYGLKATEIFLDPLPSNRPLSWRLHQFWLNALGSAVGWVALLFLLTRVFNCFEMKCSGVLTALDVVLFFLAFVGVTGYLPAAVVGIVSSIGAIIGKIAGLQK